MLPPLKGFVMKEPKLYCPFCEQELSGDTHKNDAYAWAAFYCEYNMSLQDDKPIPELKIKQEALKRKIKIKNEVNSDIRKLKERITELGLVT